MHVQWTRLMAVCKPCRDGRREIAMPNIAEVNIVRVCRGLRRPVNLWAVVNSGPWPSLRQTMAAVGHHDRPGDERG